MEQDRESKIDMVYFLVYYWPACIASPLLMKVPSQNYPNDENTLNKIRKVRVGNAWDFAPFICFPFDRIRVDSDTPWSCFDLFLDLISVNSSINVINSLRNKNESCGYKKSNSGQQTEAHLTKKY